MTMNRSFEIVTDSCCNLTEETIDRYELHVLPLTFMADGDDTVYRSYLKGRKTDLSQFYTMMREGKAFRTSLPNLADTEMLFRSLLDQAGTSYTWAFRAACRAPMRPPSFSRSNCARNTRSASC